MTPKRTWQICGIIVGDLLMLAPVLAYFWYRSGMDHARAALGSGLKEELHQGINTALYATSFGLIGFICGIIIFAVSFRSFKRMGRLSAAGNDSRPNQ
jgi:ABC-type Fe3+ transport system permease subunit